MEVRITKLTDRHIFLEFVNDTGTFPFIYTTETCRLSRCLCVHGSHYRGAKSELCYHTKLVVRYLIDTCGIKKVIP